MEISKRIVELREMRGFSTNKLASKAGISQSYLREVEMGKRNPTVEILSYICDALEISVRVFFSDQEQGIHPSLQSALEKMSQQEQLKLAEFLNEIRKSQPG